MANDAIDRLEVWVDSWTRLAGVVLMLAGVAVISLFAYAAIAYVIARAVRLAWGECS